MKKLCFVIVLSIFSIQYSQIHARGEVSTVRKNVRMDRYGNPELDPFDIRRLSSEQKSGLRDYRAGMLFLIEILYHIDNRFYKEVDMTECAFKIEKGGVSECTDRYSYYLNPEERKEEQKSKIEGKTTGIGINFELNKEGGFRILQVFEGSPGATAGLMENDLIAAIAKDPNTVPIEWISTQKMAMDKALLLIKGEAGTKVRLLIVRDNEQREIEIIRGVVEIPFLLSKIVNEKIGYVQIRQFYGEVSKQFRLSLEKMHSAGVQVIIVDLRNNPGGKMDTAAEMASLFSKTSKSYATILYVREREGDAKDNTINNRYVGQFQNKKLIVLQNGGSASASEIFAGYVQQEVGAIVIGEKSYGKGIVQSLIPLTNEGLLHITIGEYFIGKKSIKVHGVGITPDIEVKKTRQYTNEADDEQLQRAIQEAEKLLE